MKTFIQTLLWVWLLIPVTLQAQHVTEYRPAGNVIVSSVVNLESLRGSNPVVDPVPGFTRSVNTVQEFAGAAINDIWFLTSNQAGAVVNSIRYGAANGVNERASAIVDCPNGDYIILGNTNVGGFDRILAFRITPAGAILWSNTYGVPNANTRGYCIKRTNDAAESYIIAGSTSPGTGDKTLVALKITGAGNMLWNSTYFDPVVPNTIFDQPRSMTVVGNNHYIAGNRTQGAVQNIFTIAIDQVAGAIVIQYSHIDNANLPDMNPYINAVPGGGFILVYSTIFNFGGANTGRVAYTPLTGALVPAAPTTLYWEAGTTNNYGHTIYPNAANYDIGGGATAALNNPTFFSITPAGVIIAGSYRRLWAAQNFISTFMLLDPFGAAANRYAHHNHRVANMPNGMSVMRNNAGCFVMPALQSVVINNQWLQQQYVRQAPLLQQAYAMPMPWLNGNFFTCGGGVGVFKTQIKGERDEEPVEEGTFKVYPSLVTTSPLTIDMESPKDGKALITIYSMEAKPLLQISEMLRKGNNRINIDMKSVPRGTFIVELKTDDHVLKARVIKQ